MEENNDGKTVHIYRFDNYEKVQSITIDPFMTTYNHRFLMSDDFLAVAGLLLFFFSSCAANIRCSAASSGDLVLDGMGFEFWTPSPTK